MKTIRIVILVIITAVVGFKVGYHRGYHQVEMPKATYHIPQTQPSPYAAQFHVDLDGRAILLDHQGNGLYEGGTSEGVVRFIYDYGENTSLFQYDRRAGFLRPARTYEKRCDGLMAVTTEFEARSEDGGKIPFMLLWPVDPDRKITFQDALETNPVGAMVIAPFFAIAALAEESAPVSSSKMWLEK